MCSGYLAGPPDAFSKSARLRRSSTSFALIAGSTWAAAAPEVPTAPGFAPAGAAAEGCSVLPAVPAAPGVEDGALALVAGAAADGSALAELAPSGPMSASRFAATFA